MAFLHRRRSLQDSYTVVNNTKVDAKPLPFLPSPHAVENVPMKRKRTRTTSNLATGQIMKRVSSIFSSRRKAAPPDLKLVDSVLATTLPRQSFSSHIDTIDSEDDDIRIPSGLGSAATMSSLPPSPFSPPPGSAMYDSSADEYQRARAISSPNLLRSLNKTMPGDIMTRRASIAPTSILTSVIQPRKPPIQLPKEIIFAILSHLPRPSVASCSIVSRMFASAARATLYGTLNFDTLSATQSEALIMLLLSRSDLTDLVTTFICRTWPSFFLPDGKQDGFIIHPRAALLTAVFTSVLERMSNLATLVLPSFDISLLAHHSAFGLKSLTFLHPTTTDAETKALFAWLDGQINITALQFTNIEDTLYTKTAYSCSSERLIPSHDHTLPRTAPSSPLLKPVATSLFPDSSPPHSPQSMSCIAASSPSSGLDTIFSSPTLLPNLATLHATPTLATQLAAPLTKAASRPLRSVTLNINTTLYNGLRPAALMNTLHGVIHLSLRFSENVDKRSFEKVLGASGASLGRPTQRKHGVDDSPEGLKNSHSPQWGGLQSLEVAFHTGPGAHPGRDEALYKSVQASLPRYKSLTSLRLFVVSATEKESSTNQELSAPEQVLLDSWAKLCPTLRSVILFSGAQWHRKESHYVRPEPKPMEGFKFPAKT